MAEENNKTNTTTTTMKKPVHRSPNYPVIGLEKAVERTATLYEQGKLHPIPFLTACQMWNYSASSGSQNVAALKAFGLIEVTGEKDTRQIKVSDIARKIIMNHPDRSALLAEAVLSPTLYNELWQKYKPELPVDSVIRNYLVFERNFNENAVDDFIKDFRASIAFANFNYSDKISNDTEDGKGGGSMESEQLKKQGTSSEFQPFVDDLLGTKPKTNKTGVKALFEYNVPLSIQREVNATLRIDGQILKKRDLQILAKRVKELIDAFEEEEVVGEAVSIKAVWHNNDFDIPVIIVSNPEKAGDGREYVSIEGSDSRIPYDEVEIEDE